MNNSYELNLEISNYKRLKRELNKIYNMLYNSEMQHDINVAISSLENNLNIDDNYIKLNKLKKVNENISSKKTIIRNMIYEIDKTIKTLNMESGDK